MSEPNWAKYVVWPECRRCNSKGFVTRGPDAFPEECQQCKGGREAAVKNAQSYRRREVKAGREA